MPRQRGQKESRRKVLIAGADSRSPLQSYHWPLCSLDMCSCERRRTHSSSLVWKNSTGSLRRLHHSQLISSEARRHTFSRLFRSAPAGCKQASNSSERDRAFTIKGLTTAASQLIQNNRVFQNRGQYLLLTFCLELDAVHRKLHTDRQKDR